MKNKKLLILSLCLIILGGLTTSCTEEDIKPTNADGIYKDGNITGVDDWHG